MGQIANQALVELIYKMKNRIGGIKEEQEPIDFSCLNHLPAETKQLIVNAQTLVGETKSVLADKQYYFDMTSKNQIKTDCRRVEKAIRAICNGKTDAKSLKELEISTICLQTTLEGVIQFFSR